VLDDVARIRAAVVQACADIEATPMQVVAHRFAPQGVTATVVIAESHLSIHTWPEHGYAAVDVFTCGGLDPRKALPGLQAALRSRRGRVQEIVRGLDEHVDGVALPEDVLVLSQVSPLEPTRP
jgi:S-adenosylmethionine decarboxylase proenzyme